jgi:SAM-dependent methyltransferase
MKDFWNSRYSESEYVYGKEPSLFFKNEIDRLTPGSLFLPGEGEGRNAVYAAKKGWDVHALDISEEGRKKALALAEEHRVIIRYSLESIETAPISPITFDVAAFIFVHLPPELFSVAIKKTAQSLKPGGKLIFQLYTKSQLGRDSGGPKSIEMLFDLENFSSTLIKLGFHLPDIREEEILLNEGKFHSGKAMVIRGVAHKEM